MNGEHSLAHALLDSMHRTTPGGIQRDQFVRRHPLKTLVGALPFLALVLLGAFWIITR